MELLSPFKKHIKVILTILTFVSFLSMFTWKGSLILMAIIAWHELGHLLAFKMLKIETHGFYFIPFFGGATLPKEIIKDYFSIAIAAFYGPLAGFIQVIFLLGLYKVTGSLLIVDIAFITSAFNFLNMLPITPFDGGQIIRAVNYSINPWFAKIFAVIAFLIGAFFCAKLSILAIVFYATLGIFDLVIDLYLRDKFKMGRPHKMKWGQILIVLAVYLFISFGLGSIAYTLLKAPEFNKVDSLQM